MSLHSQRWDGLWISKAAWDCQAAVKHKRLFLTHPSLANTRDEESHRPKCKLHKTAEGWQMETKSIVGQFSSFHEEKLAPEANWRLYLQENPTLSASYISNGEKDVTSHLNHREEFL